MGLLWRIFKHSSTFPFSVFSKKLKKTFLPPGEKEQSAIADNFYLSWMHTMRTLRYFFDLCFEFGLVLRFKSFSEPFT